VRVGPRGLGAAAEFGAWTHPVFGRVMSQLKFKKKVWPGWRGNKTDAGYMVFETLRKHGPEIVAMYSEKILEGLRAVIPHSREHGG